LPITVNFDGNVHAFLYGFLIALDDSASDTQILAIVNNLNSRVIALSLDQASRAFWATVIYDDDAFDGFTDLADDG
jgi:hypothetical protein